MADNVTVGYRGQTKADAAAVAWRLGLPRPTADNLRSEVLVPICRALASRYGATEGGSVALDLHPGDVLAVDFDLPLGSLGPTYATVSVVGVSAGHHGRSVVDVDVRAIDAHPVLAVLYLFTGLAPRVRIHFAVPPLSKTQWWALQFD
jgi:hypothetical protein